MAKVSLKSVTKIYPGRNGGDVTAVDDLTLEIQDREFVVLAGPPNCGISSIVRMIAGLEDVSKGDIFIGDRRVNDLPPKDRDIALVSQNYAPYPRMSVHDNLAFGLKLRKFPEAEVKKRVARGGWNPRAPGAAGAQTRIPFREQRQRLAIARALALQPKVFLFDEPLADAGSDGTRANAQRDRETASAFAGDDDLRHARSGRSDGDGRPDCRA